MAQQTPANAAANPNEPQFGIQRIYTKDTSFEAPHAPQIFREQWQPKVNMDINTHSEKLEDNVFEVVLHLTVTAKINEKMAFLAEVKQAGIFTIHQFPESQMPQILGSFCPNVIYPYARETVTDQVIRGGFPQLYLAPINFDALFEQQMAQAKPQKPAKKDH